MQPGTPQNLILFLNVLERENPLRDLQLCLCLKVAGNSSSCQRQCRIRPDPQIDPITDPVHPR